MSLVPLQDTARFLIRSSSGIEEAVLTNRGDETELLLTGVSSVVVLSLDESTPLPFLVQSLAGVSEVVVEMKEGCSPGIPVELRFDYGIGEISQTRKEFNFSSFFSLEQIAIGLSYGYDLWVPERKNIAHTFDYGMGTLTQFQPIHGFRYGAYNYATLTASRSVSFAWKAHSLTRIYSDLSFLQGIYVVTYKYPVLDFTFETRNWESMVFGDSMEMGVNVQTRADLSTEVTIGVLGTSTPKISWAYTLGNIKLEHRGFGFEYIAADPWVFRLRDLSMAYQVRNDDFLEFTQSWGLDPSAVRRDFGFSYAQTYMATTHLGFSFARDFSVVFLDFGFYSVKERFLLGAVSVKVPFAASMGTGLVYSLNERVACGLQLIARLEDPLLLGVSFDIGLSRLLNGVTLSLPLHRRIQFALDLPVPFTRHLRGVGVSLTLPFTRQLLPLRIEIPLPFTRLVSALQVRVISPYMRRINPLGIELPAPHTFRVVRPTLLSLPVRDYVTAGSGLSYDNLPFTLLVFGPALSSPLIDSAPAVLEAVTMHLYPTSPSTIPSPPDPHAPIGDPEEIAFISARVEIDEGSFGWTGTFEMENVRDLYSFQAHSLFTFRIGAVDYVFMVDAKNLTRSDPPSVQAILKGVSPGVQLTAPRSRKITKTWDVPMMSHDLIREVAGDFPIEITILNWPIPAYRYGVSSASPMDIIKQIAGAVGGEVDSLPNGTLRVRPRFPVPTNRWGPEVVDFHYSDEDDIYTSDNQDVPLRVFDKFRVMDAHSSVESDRLDFKELTSQSGEVRAYPSPWRTEVELVSASNRVTVGEFAEEYRDEEETIEIFKGAGSVKFPVVSVNSVQWMDSDQAGVVAGNDSTRISASLGDSVFSMLKISYKTRCLVFPVQGEVGLQAQFVLRNL